MFFVTVSPEETHVNVGEKEFFKVVFTPETGMKYQTEDSSQALHKRLMLIPNANDIAKVSKRLKSENVHEILQKATSTLHPHS